MDMQPIFTTNLENFSEIHTAYQHPLHTFTLFDPQCYEELQWWK